MCACPQPNKTRRYKPTPSQPPAVHACFVTTHQGPPATGPNGTASLNRRRKPRGPAPVVLSTGSLLTGFFPIPGVPPGRPHPPTSHHLLQSPNKPPVGIDLDSEEAIELPPQTGVGHVSEETYIRLSELIEAIN